MVELGLNTTHEQQVLSFLEFSKAKRAQCLKDVEIAFSELAESRLLDDTFTSEEVRDMLDGVCAVLKADVGSDLIHNSHTSALLLRQLFQQAEHWHLKLKVDLSEIQSGELLAKIADFEQRELSGGSAIFQKHRQLEPINTTGGEKLLQMEISRLKEENNKLQSRSKELEGMVTQTLSAKDKLQEEFLRRQSSPSLPTTQTDTAHLHKQIAELKLQLSKDSIKAPSTDTSGESALKKELEATSHKLLKTTAELEEAKKDLQRRFSETTQYNNMRKMMESKTATIQALRAQLKQMGEKET